MTPNPKRKRNTSRKGQQLEGHARAILESQGYEVATAGKVLAWTPKGPRSKQHDLFGCIDLIGVQSKRVVRFVQVTDKHNRRARERKATPFAKGSPYEHADVEVWGFVAGRRPAGQRFRVTRWLPLGGWVDCEDEVCVPRSTERAGKAP